MLLLNETYCMYYNDDDDNDDGGNNNNIFLHANVYSIVVGCYITRI